MINEKSKFSIGISSKKIVIHAIFRAYKSAKSILKLYGCVDADTTTGGISRNSHAKMGIRFIFVSYLRKSLQNIL